MLAACVTVTGMEICYGGIVNEHGGSPYIFVELGYGGWGASLD